MTTLGCKIKRDQAAAFKAYCENQGSTSNTVLKDFVLECIGEPVEAPANREGVLPLKAAQAAAEAAGERVPQFLARAVEEQAQRDRSSLELGINSSTEGKIGEE